jgi:hypothetical protein
MGLAVDFTAPNPLPIFSGKPLWARRGTSLRAFSEFNEKMLKFAQIESV